MNKNLNKYAALLIVSYTILIKLHFLTVLLKCYLQDAYAAKCFRVKSKSARV